VTSGLVQQLSLAEPQFVVPAALSWQLGGPVEHAPMEQDALPEHADDDAS
jgi:hypothetical protein